MQIQSSGYLEQHQLVVICFKFSNFAYANTVQLIRTAFVAKLLFALNLVTLLMQIQFLGIIRVTPISCYLL